MSDPYDETQLDRPQRIDRRDKVIGLSGLTALAGLWLLASPVLLDYAADDPVLVDMVTGLVIMILALVRVAGAYRATWPSLLNIALGVWVVTGVWRAETATAAINDLFVGALVVLFASASALATASAMRDGGSGGRGARDDNPARAEGRSGNL